ncbi:MAG TPA: hypothetical protein VI383_03925, partial [Gemmatimonadales bacterium]|nr:hypothetical protein [Gemmatimonadales bacterium]
PPLTLDLDQPTPLGLARLERCAARPAEPALATGFRIAEALASRGVDDRFFAEFRRTLARVMEALPPRIPQADRHGLGLLQLTRILFLYFIESRGWLGAAPGGGGGRRFLREAVDSCLAERRSLHRDLFDPLFFGTLNRPFEARSRLARRFGPVPFLNGGLFEPHPLERRWRVTLPTPVLREALDSLFERFHFTIGTDPIPPGETIAPDMLGRVFEGVMEPGERHDTGTYYTPARLVTAVLRDALAAWLARRLRIRDPEAERRLDEPDGPAREALRDIRILDPAAGSGAFLLGALRLLAGPSRPGTGTSSKLRAVLEGSLFGVDRNAAAVRLAELRLWLEVVAAEPSEPVAVAPLPNLDALIRQGDSLRDPARGIPLPPPCPSRSAELAALRAEVTRSAGAAKAGALGRLRAAELGLAEAALSGGVRGLEESVAELVELARGVTLFGDRRGLTRGERVRLKSLREARRRGRNRLRTLRRTGEVPWFQYPVQFADVMGRGGFDLVVGNPPWVRSEALDPAERRYLAERFRFWHATHAGAGYAHPPDLSVAFLERGLELAAPDGVVAFLVPAKLATTRYAAPVRGEMALRTTIVTAADLRGDPRSTFDATVYPMALVLHRDKPPEDHRVRLGLGPAGHSPGVLQRELGSAPWVLVGEALRATLERLGAEFPALGDRFACQLGVKTGLNRAFLDPPQFVEPGLVRWAIRGRDVEPFRVRRVRRLLWPCTPEGRPLPSLPPGAARHLASFTEPLRRRRDRRGPEDQPWTLFRTGPAASPYRVVWPDLARRLTAAPLTGRSDRDLIPLNSCYVIAARDRDTALRLSAWLNSTWCRALAAAVADPASGGFRRFNARVVSSLPCPPALLFDDRLLELAEAGVREGWGEGPAQDELDDRTADLLALSGAERRALAELDRPGAQPGGRIASAG